MIDPEKKVKLLSSFKEAFDTMLTAATTFRCPVCGNDTLRSEWGEHDTTVACPQCGMISPKSRVSTVFNLGGAKFPAELRDHARTVVNGISKIQNALGERLRRYGVFDGKDAEQQELLSLQFAVSIREKIEMWLKRLVPNFPFTDEHISDIIVAVLKKDE